MTLYFVGIGPSLEYMSLKAIDILRKSNKIYVDTYTNIIPGFSIEKLAKITGRKDNIVLARRTDLEGRSIKKIIDEARTSNVAIVVPGDPFIATTHDAIRLEALENNVDVDIVYGVTIYSMAASATGLQAYKFGKTVTLVYPREFKPYSTIEAIRENHVRGLHTLVLLDLKLEEGIAMTINEAVDIIIELEKDYCSQYNCKPVLEKTLGVACIQLGTEKQVIQADFLYRLKNYSYPEPPHSIIITGNLHPIELDLLKYIGKMPSDVYNYFKGK